MVEILFFLIVVERVAVIVVVNVVVSNIVSVVMVNVAVSVFVAVTDDDINSFSFSGVP